MPDMFDVFISFAEDDREWTEGFLLAALTTSGIRCCTVDNFPAGMPLLEASSQAVESSDRIIVVLSPAYVSDHAQPFVALLLQHFGSEQLTWPVIPILLRPTELPLRLRVLNPLDATSQDKWGPVVERLSRELLAANQANRERSVFRRLFRTGNEELQAELRNREAQLLEQASLLDRQQAQLRQQATRLRELAEFDRQSSITGGVFISYSHDDKDVVNALAHRLAADEINYWLDEKDLFVGDVVDKAISKGIQESLLFIIVLTPTSISSKWVDRELDEAAHEETEGRKIILPVVKDLSPEQIPARLRRKLYVDISKSFDDGCAKLTRSIRHHLRTQVLKSSSAP